MMVRSSAALGIPGRLPGAMDAHSHGDPAVRRARGGPSARRANCPPALTPGRERRKNSPRRKRLSHSENEDPMRLITFDDGRVGRIDGDAVIPLDCGSTREFFGRGGSVPETGERLALADVTLRAPIQPK